MIAVIGDVHQKFRPYNRILSKYEYTIQIGDFGFNYFVLDDKDSTKHKFFPGNHDNYDYCYEYPHCLGDYGSFSLDNKDFFFIRGGFSIDKKYRMPGVDWFPNEELNLEECNNCLNLYKETKPDIVLSHECPDLVARLIGNPDVLREWGFNPETFQTKTQILLQQCFEYHQPKLWIFGHFHKTWQQIVNNTHFICLNELEILEL